MKVSVFIPTWNRQDSLQTCLNSLAEQTYGNFEVIIVDGGSVDGTNTVVAKYTKLFPIVLIEERTPGLTRAANTALNVASGDIFTRTDDDVIASRGWLEAIVETFLSSDSIGGVTGPTLMPPEYMKGRDIMEFHRKAHAESALGWKVLERIYHGYLMEGHPFDVSRFFRSGAFSIGSNFPESLTLPKPIAADHLEACNWSARTDLVRRVGGFDNAFGGVGEYHEADVAMKIKCLGYRLLFVPQADVEHHPSTSGVYASRQQAFSRASNFVLFYFRHIKPNTLDKSLRFATYLAIYNLYFVYKFATTKKAAHLSGLAGTFVALVRYAPEIFTPLQVERAK